MSRGELIEVDLALRSSGLESYGRQNGIASRSPNDKIIEQLVGSFGLQRTTSGAPVIIKLDAIAVRTYVVLAIVEGYPLHGWRRIDHDRIRLDLESNLWNYFRLTRLVDGRVPNHDVARAPAVGFDEGLKAEIGLICDTDNLDVLHTVEEERPVEPIRIEIFNEGLIAAVVERDPVFTVQYLGVPQKIDVGNGIGRLGIAGYPEPRVHLRYLQIGNRNVRRRV